MDIFDVISLLGGLAMFLYGMRLMGDSLKENSSGALKLAMEKVTNNPFKAFILGVLVTALIQSSTAMIVITAGLVGAGILTLHQALGIIVGANVGTTVTGQIIRLLDIDSSGAAWLRFFQPFNHGTTFSRLAMRPPAILPIVPANGLTGSLYLGFQIHDFHTFASLIRAFRLSKRLSCTLSLLAKLRITSSSRPPLTIR